MISNYYTLFHIVKDLQYQITSSTITDVFTQFEGEFVITLKSGEEERFLIVSCEPSRNFLLFTERFSRARRNSMTLFEKLKDARIYQIFIHPADREITLQMAGNYRLIIHLYGHKANAFVVDEHNVIVDAFLKPREVVGS